jgi:hypothetical protein
MKKTELLLTTAYMRKDMEMDYVLGWEIEIVEGTVKVNFSLS